MKAINTKKRTHQDTLKKEKEDGTGLRRSTKNLNLISGENAVPRETNCLLTPEKIKNDKNNIL